MEKCLFRKNEPACLIFTAKNGHHVEAQHHSRRREKKRLFFSFFSKCLKPESPAEHLRHSVHSAEQSHQNEEAVPEPENLFMIVVF